MRVLQMKVTGSPPPMRGKVYPDNPDKGHAWITPAYAGKSAPAISPVMITWDHPRLCGEKSTAKIVYTSAEGSPPRMRGKATYTTLQNILPGITPAYAGKSCYWKMDRCTKLGSPPPMRGKGFRKLGERSADGITPAYAGKSIHG